MSNPFDLTPEEPTEEIDIETLFKDLKKRSPEIKSLYAQQADIIREYQSKHIKTENVGIELPTGSGKTLIGLLIGEWRRRFLKQRIFYLCPTIQLTYQVHEQSKQYGIDTRVFVRSKRGFDRRDLGLYSSGETIAISTYSGLFNESPGIKDPQTIILDDAHGAESYIGKMWSLDINKFVHEELYNKIIDIFEPDLPQRFIEVLHSGNRDLLTQTIESVPYGSIIDNIRQLHDALDDYITDDDLNLFFAWRAINSHLLACQIYISFDSILIRPYISPTLTHKPFANAEQRIFMSATLGRGGELERITGLQTITKIAAPKTYESRAIGRRLYIFPDYALNFDEYSKWILKRIISVERSLVLCPNGNTADQFKKLLDISQLSVNIFTAKDIEETLKPFIGSKNSILLLTNRYDGIDLPGGVCKQCFIVGIPSGTNLQETFIQGRLGLDVLINERIKTRIQQASGRCTRNDTDIAALIMLDSRLMDYCSKNENQKIFHPEMRAEIRFAFRQKADTLNKIDAMLGSFLAQDANWRSAEKFISQLRATEKPADTTVTSILEDIVKDEVNFMYAFWSEDYPQAVKYGIRVADKLTAPPVLTPYRALWYYYIATAAKAASQTSNSYEKIVIDYLSRAKAACTTISWFPNALKSMLPEQSEPDIVNERNALAIEGIIQAVKKLGISGTKFSAKLTEVETLLHDTEAVKFDRGLVELGTLLGFTSFKPSGSGAPDACWYLENDVLFVFEGKSDEKSDAPISIENCRQTSGHITWADSKDTIKNIKNKHVILVSPKSKIDSDATKYGANIYYISINEIINIFNKTKLLLEESRTMLSDEVNEDVGNNILQNLIKYKLTPMDLEKMLTPITKIPSS